MQNYIEIYLRYEESIDENHNTIIIKINKQLIEKYNKNLLSMNDFTLTELKFKLANFHVTQIKTSVKQLTENPTFFLLSFDNM